jgi:hypothetical protein
MSVIVGGATTEGWMQNILYKEKRIRNINAILKFNIWINTRRKFETVNFNFICESSSSDRIKYVQFFTYSLSTEKQREHTCHRKSYQYMYCHNLTNLGMKLYKQDYCEIEREVYLCLKVETKYENLLVSKTTMNLTGLEETPGGNICVQISEQTWRQNFKFRCMLLTYKEYPKTFFWVMGISGGK